MLGEPIVRVVGSALGPIAIVAVVLAIAGAVGWWALARRRRAVAGGTDGAASTDTAVTPLAAVTAWADACCPACLSLAALEARR